MADLFLVLFIISFSCLIAGLVNPSIFTPVFKRKLTRKKIGLIFGVALLVFFVLTGATNKPKESVKQSIEPEETIETTEEKIQISEVEPTPTTIVLTSTTLPASTATTVSTPTTLPMPTTTIASTPTPAKEWTKVIKLTANNNKQSETFYLSGGQQKLVYSVSGDELSEGMCLIYVMKEGEEIMTEGGIPVVWQDGNVNDDTLMRKNAGYYYLDLQVGWGSCVVEIYEFK